MPFILIGGLVIFFGVVTVLNTKEQVPENCINLQTSCCSCSREACHSEEN